MRTITAPEEVIDTLFAYAYLGIMTAEKENKAIAHMASVTGTMFTDRAEKRGRIELRSIIKLTTDYLEEEKE